VSDTLAARIRQLCPRVVVADPVHTPVADVACHDAVVLTGAEKDAFDRRHRARATTVQVVVVEGRGQYGRWFSGRDLPADILLPR
jgi:hypothetical protein